MIETLRHRWVALTAPLVRFLNVLGGPLSRWAEPTVCRRHAAACRADAALMAAHPVTAHWAAEFERLAQQWDARAERAGR